MLHRQTPAPVGRPRPAEAEPIVDASGMYIVAVESRQAAEAQRH
jgi:hypothetical protein